MRRWATYSTGALALLVVASWAPGSRVLGAGPGLQWWPPPHPPRPAVLVDVRPPAEPTPAGMFIVGEIVLGEAEPGQLSVVAAGRIDDSGHLPIVVRNGRDDVVYDVRVELRGADASGAEVAVAEYFIPTAGLAPGEWAFGGNAVAVPGLSQVQDVRLRFSASSEPGDFVRLDVTRAELRDGAIVGTVTNRSNVAVGDFNPVNVACFDGGVVTAYQMPMARSIAQRLDPGESANFTTEQPIDAATCPAFAVYSLGLVGA